MIVKIISKLGSKASARLRKGAKGFDLLAKTRQLTMDETGIAFFFIGPKTYQTLATHPQIIVKNMMRIAGKKFKFAILPDTAANPAKAWHQKRHDIYSDRLADDLKAGHGGG